MRVFARDLDGALVRLRTGVAEERPVESRELHEFRCGICLRLCIVEVRAVDHLACLTADGLDERCVGVAEHVDGDAAEEVEVLVPVHVIGIGSLAVVENDLVTTEDRQIVRRILSKNLLIYFTHKTKLSYLTTCVPMPCGVSTSSRMECARRPSMICALTAPASSALRHASIFGIMPPSMMPVLMYSRASA